MNWFKGWLHLQYRVWIIGAILENVPLRNSLIAVNDFHPISEKHFLAWLWCLSGSSNILLGLAVTESCSCSTSPPGPNFTSVPLLPLILPFFYFFSCPFFFLTLHFPTNILPNHIPLPASVPAPVYTIRLFCFISPFYSFIYSSNKHTQFVFNYR